MTFLVRYTSSVDVNRALKKVDTREEFCTSRDTAEPVRSIPMIAIGEQLRGLSVVQASRCWCCYVSRLSQVAPIETRVDPASKERIPVSQ